MSEKDILSALTTTPAQMIKAENQLGTIESGKLANFIIASGNIISKDVSIYQNWVKGKAYTVNDMPEIDIRGDYELNINNQKFNFVVKKPSTKNTCANK